MYKAIETRIEDIKRINAISITTLKSELGNVYSYFYTEFQNQPKEIMRTAMTFKKTLYTTMKKCDDMEKAFQLGIYFEKMNALISQCHEQAREESMQTVLADRVPNHLFNYLYEHGVCEKETLEDEFVLDIVPHMNRLIESGLVYVSYGDDCEYYGLTAEGYTYKRTKGVNKL